MRVVRLGQARRTLAQAVCILALLISFAATNKAQDARIVERLADGSYVVLIDNVEHRAISGEKAVEIAKQKIELKECRDNEGNYKQIISLAAKDITIANQKVEIEHGNFVRAMAMYDKERELRTEAQSQFIPHGSKSNWLLKALDSPYSQAFWKIALPLAQTYGAYKQ